MIGIHCNKGKDFVESIKNLGMPVVQIFTHGPRTTKVISFDEEKMKELSKNVKIYVHQTYCTSWTKNLEHMREQCQMIEKINSAGLVLHLAKMSPDDHIKVLQDMPKVPILLEMRALKTDKWVYQTPDEINQLCEALIRADMHNVGICIDTAHINAGGILLKTSRQVDTYFSALKFPQVIKLIHLNGNEYDPTVRAGDKHCIPLSKEDFVFQKEGLERVVHWAKSQKWDIILEQDLDDNLMKFYKTL